MKRPDGPAGGEPEGEERDADGAGEDRPRKGASRPSGRGARRSLAARVAGEKPDADEGAKRTAKETGAAKEKPAAGKKPAARKAAEKAKPPTKPKPRPGAAKKPPAGGKATPGKDEKPKRELHRPRRQGDAATAKSKSGSDARRKRGSGEAGERKSRQTSKPARRRERDRKRERRRKGSVGRRVRGAARSAGATVKRSAVAVRKQVTTNAPKVGARLLTILVAFYAVFFTVLGRIVGVGLAAARVVAPPIRRAGRFLRRVVDGASRIATPKRVLALVVAGAAVLLALSQYADYRSISIGNGAYAGVQAIAPAPETARAQTGDAHSYVFVPIAIACLLLLAGTMTGRWRLCRLISLAGVAAIVVALVIDRPAGLAPGDVAAAYEGVEATLIGGFYAQIAAGLVLTVASSLLARELRLAAAPVPVAKRSHKPVREGRALGADAGVRI